MAEALFGGVPDWIQEAVYQRLDAPLRHEVAAFAEQYGVPVSTLFRRS